MAKAASTQPPAGTGQRQKQASVVEIGRQYYARNRDKLIFSRGRWHFWNGAVWEPIYDLHQRYEFWKLMEEFEQKDGQKPALSKCHAVEDYVRSRCFVPESQLDSYTTLVNLRNGVYNLDDGNLYPHNPDYYMTTLLPFDYDPDARPDMFQLYLMTTFVQPRSTEFDQELAEFVQEAVGYSLTTDISQHVTFWCIGEGANGKGVLFHILERLGGTAAMTLNVGLLAREQYQLALLAGKRIALCSEANATQNLVDDATIKSLVAGDTMSVRQIRREPFELKPTAKLWWAMNELPAVADTSEGFWRRMRVIPFNRVFRDDERIMELKDLLDLELPGIFNWAMAGLQRLRGRGHFVEPVQVKDATGKYRQEANPVKLFVDEMCSISLNAREQSSVIYRAYKEWCSENTFRPHSSRNFKREMQRLGFFLTSLGAGNFYTGVALRTPPWP